MGHSKSKPGYNGQNQLRFTKVRAGSMASDVNTQHEKQDVLISRFCCGVEVKSQKKVKLSWEDNATKFCVKNKSQFGWVDEVMTILKIRDNSRRKFVKQFNNIRYMQEQPHVYEKNMLLSPAQLKKFQNNLRRSILLHPSQVCNPLNSTKISTTLQPTFDNIRLTFNPQLGQVYRQQNNKLLSHISFRENPGSFVKKANPYSSQIAQKKQLVKKSGLQLNLRQSVINLVDDTVQSMFKGQQQQISKLNQATLQTFIKFTIMIEKHLTDPQHKIGQILKSFYAAIYKSYSLSESEAQISLKKKGEQLSIDLQFLIDEIKIFILFLTQSVEDYYNLKSLEQKDELLSSFSQINTNEQKSLKSSTYIPMKNYNNNTSLITNYENVLTLVTSVVFQDQKFYKFILSKIREFHKEKEEEVKRRYEQLEGKKPEYFNVNQQYCLNYMTIKMFIDEDDDTEQGCIKSQSKENVYIQNLVPEDLQSLQQEPYIKCSKALKKLLKCKTPISKLKAILESAELITQSILQFYSSNRLSISNQLIDADQVLSIFCYILSISKIQDIHSQIFFIEQFSTEHQKISMTGYYLSVLSCAVEENFSERRRGQTQVNIKAYGNTKQIATN